MKLIRLSNGNAASVDDEDYPFLNRFRWMGVEGKSGSIYPIVRMVYNGGQIMVKMGRLIMNPPKGFMVDHINGDTLNNQKANMRLATPTGNARNARPFGATSRYKGVSRFGESGKAWCAGVYNKADRSTSYVGYFASEEDAALAYDAAARERHGEYAWINEDHFPELARYRAATR